MEWSLGSWLPSHNISFKSVHNFLSNPANITDKQTNTQTDKQGWIHNIRPTTLANVIIITPWNACSGWSCYAGARSYVWRVTIVPVCLLEAVVSAGWCPQLTNEHCEVLFFINAHVVSVKTKCSLYGPYTKDTHISRGDHGETSMATQTGVRQVARHKFSMYGWIFENHRDIEMIDVYSK